MSPSYVYLQIRTIPTSNGHRSSWAPAAAGTQEGFITLAARFALSWPSFAEGGLAVSSMRLWILMAVPMRKKAIGPTSAFLRIGCAGHCEEVRGEECERSLPPQLLVSSKLCVTCIITVRLSIVVRLWSCSCLWVMLGALLERGMAALHSWR